MDLTELFVLLVECNGQFVMYGFIIGSGPNTQIDNANTVNNFDLDGCLTN